MAKNVHIHFRNGENFRFGEYFFSSASADRKLYRLRKKQEKLEKAAKMDYETMRKVKFTL